MLNHVGSHLNRFIKTNESLDVVDCLPYRSLEYVQLYIDTVARVQDTLENLVKLNDTYGLTVCSMGTFGSKDSTM